MSSNKLNWLATNAPGRCEDQEFYVAEFAKNFVLSLTKLVLPKLLASSATGNAWTKWIGTLRE